MKMSLPADSSWSQADGGAGHGEGSRGRRRVDRTLTVTLTLEALRLQRQRKGCPVLAEGVLELPQLLVPVREESDPLLQVRRGKPVPEEKQGHQGGGGGGQ